MIPEALRNRSRLPGMGGHDEPEWPVTFVRNRRSRCSGIPTHRVELIDGDCWTIFVTGPRYREWGFHCADRGWVHWKKFTATDNRGEIGKGCDA